MAPSIRKGRPSRRSGFNLLNIFNRTVAHSPYAPKRMFTLTVPLKLTRGDSYTAIIKKNARLWMDTSYEDSVLSLKATKRDFRIVQATKNAWVRPLKKAQSGSRRQPPRRKVGSLAGNNELGENGQKYYNHSSSRLRVYSSSVASSQKNIFSACNIAPRGNEAFGHVLNLDAAVARTVKEYVSVVKGEFMWGRHEIETDETSISSDETGSSSCYSDEDSTATSSSYGDRRCRMRRKGKPCHPQLSTYIYYIIYTKNPSLRCS